MNIKKLSLTKSDENIIYDCEKMNFLVKKKNAISLNHVHPKTEVIFLVEGRIELKVGDENKRVEAPVKIEIPPNVCHKIVALTDVRILYYYK